jgi:hypothetical protein
MDLHMGHHVALGDTGHNDEQLFRLAIEEGGGVQVMGLHAIVDSLEGGHVQLRQQVVQAIAKTPELGDPFKLRLFLGSHADQPPCLSVSVAFYILCVLRVSAVKTGN